MPAGPIQATNYGSGSRATATSHTLTLTASPPIGSLFFLHYTIKTGVTLNGNPSDDAGNTYTAIGGTAVGTVIRVVLAWTRIAAIPTTLTQNLNSTASMAWTTSAFGGGPGGGYPSLASGSPGSGVGGTGAGVTSIAVATAVSPNIVQERLYVQSVGNDLAATGITPQAGWTEIDDVGTATAGCRIDSSWRSLATTSSGVGGGSGSAASWAQASSAFDLNELAPRIGAVSVYRSMPTLERARR